MPDLIDIDEEGSITQQSKASNDSDQSLGMSSNDSSFVTGNNSIDANGAEECDQYSAPMKHSRHALEDTNTGEICRDGINIGDQTMQATVNSHRVSRHSNDNFAQSDSGGALEDDSACDFPLVLALAATANEMARNTDQMDVRNKSTHCAHHILGIVPRLVIRSMLSSCKCIDLENRLRERDNAVARLEVPLLPRNSSDHGLYFLSSVDRKSAAFVAGGIHGKRCVQNLSGYIFLLGISCRFTYPKGARIGITTEKQYNASLCTKLATQSKHTAFILPESIGRTGHFNRR